MTAYPSFLALTALFICACSTPLGVAGEDAGSDDSAVPLSDFGAPRVDLGGAPADLAPLCRKNADCPGSGMACCSGVCIDPGADSNNCGACGLLCGGGLHCCNGACADTALDPTNCGVCNMACAAINAKAVCSAGACALGACQSGWGNCDQDPANGCETSLHSDIQNCGMCGRACSVANGTAGCSNGCYVKACNFGFDDCNTLYDDGCETPTLSDLKNCGGCGTFCQGKPFAKIGCLLGSCAITACTAGFLDCDGAEANGCEVNGAQDANNCGGCGTICPMGLVCKNSQCTCPNCFIPNAATKCVNNMCVFDKCLAGYGDCDGNAKNGCEADLGGDANNCGACGNACPMGNTCSNGACSLIVVSDTNWKQIQFAPNGWEQPGFNDNAWTLATDEGAHGTAPWGTLAAFAGTTAHWVWYYDSRNGDDTSTVYFRRAFTATAANVTLIVTGDNDYTVYLDGVQVATSNDVWSVVHTWPLTLKPSHAYVMAVRVTNAGGPGGLLLDME